MARGQVAIYDATNTTRVHRAMVRTRGERSGGFQVLLSEIRSDDWHIIEVNIRSTKAGVEQC